MTTTNRPLAALFAAVMFTLLWVPTLAMPAQATAPAVSPAELA